MTVSIIPSPLGEGGLIYRIVLITTEVIIHRFPWGIILWKHSPLYSAFGNVKKSIHNITKAVFSLTLVRINQIFDNLPLAFAQIAWIGFHLRLFFSPLQTDEIYPSIGGGLFTFYSHSIVNQYID